MEQAFTFISTYLNTLLLSVIVLSGLFITKYFKSVKIADSYKVLIASIIISIGMYFIEGCDINCIPKYLFTYLFATSFYELIVKYIISKISKYLDNELDK